MPEDVGRRVRRLIELAVHPTANENEARNAALAACKLIAEHKLLVPPRRAAPPQPHIPPDVNPFEELLRKVAGMGGEGVFVHFETAQPPRRPAPTPPQPSVARGRAKPRRDPNAKQIPVTDQAAFCVTCGQRILRGKFATWVAGAIYHPSCYENATEP